MEIIIIYINVNIVYSAVHIEEKQRAQYLTIKEALLIGKASIITLQILIHQSIHSVSYTHLTLPTTPYV